jgi:hypothetical protein
MRHRDNPQLDFARAIYSFRALYNFVGSTAREGYHPAMEVFIGPTYPTPRMMDDGWMDGKCLATQMDSLLEETCSGLFSCCDVCAMHRATGVIPILPKAYKGVGGMSLLMAARVGTSVHACKRLLDE